MTVVEQPSATCRTSLMKFGDIATLRYRAIIEVTPNVSRGKTHWFPPEYWPLVYQREPDRLKNFGLLIRHPVRSAVREAVVRFPTEFEFWTQAPEEQWIHWLFANVTWITDGRLLYGAARNVPEAEAPMMSARGKDYPITLGGVAVVDEAPEL